MLLTTFLLRILLAVFIGMIIGLRTSRKVVGMFAIICTGSALLTIVSTEFYQAINYPWFSDPGRLSSQIITALGFLGTGLIWVSEKNEVRGLTVAAGIWLTAIMGILIGSGLGYISVLAIVIIEAALAFRMRR